MLGDQLFDFTVLSVSSYRIYDGRYTNLASRLHYGVDFFDQTYFFYPYYAQYSQYYGYDVRDLAIATQGKNEGLLSKLDVNVDELDGQNRTDFDRRTELNREAKRLRASSYSFRFASSESTSYASETALKRSSAAVSPGFLSGWSSRARERYFFLIAAASASLPTPRIA